MKSATFEDEWPDWAGHAGARKRNAVPADELAESCHAPPPHEERIASHIGCVGMKDRVYVQFAPHQYVNVHAAVHYRIPVGGKVWTCVDALIAATRDPANGRPKPPAALPRQRTLASSRRQMEFA